MAHPIIGLMWRSLNETLTKHHKLTVRPDLDEVFVDDAEKVSCASYEHDPKRGAPPPFRNMHAAPITDQSTAKRSVTREQTEPLIKGN